MVRSPRDGRDDNDSVLQPRAESFDYGLTPSLLVQLDLAHRHLSVGPLLDYLHRIVLLENGIGPHEAVGLPAHVLVGVVD